MTDAVSLVPHWQVGDVVLTSYPFGVAADSSVDIGEPEMVVESVVSLLADGDIQRVSRHGNRTYVLEVYIEGPTLGEIAASEALLRGELKRPLISLTHDPGDSLTPTSVYEVQVARLTPQRRDEHESHLIRRFTLTLTCSPFARSATPTTVEALPAAGAPVTVTINNADTTTGWSASATSSHGGTSSPTVTDQGTFVQVTATMPTNPLARPVGVGEWTLTLKLAVAAVDMTSTPYVRVETSGSGGSLGFSVKVGGALSSVTPTTSRAISSTVTEHFLDVSALGTSLTEVHVHRSGVGTETLTTGVHDVSRTNTLTQVSPRQVARVIDVGGTERTPGSLRVSAPDGTTDLALTIVSTWPDTGSGFSPPLRRWRLTGNTETTTAATFSGKREPLWPNYVEHDIPVQSLPDGTYQLMGLLRASTAGDYRVESVIQSRHNDVTLGETTWGETVNFPVANDWKLVPMGHYRVPIVAAKAGEFRVAIKTPNGAGVEYDEAWLFPMEEDCALTAWLAPEPHAWLDSPDLTTRVPQVFEGTSDDKSDAHWPRNGVHTMGQHVFTPGRTAVFSATHGVDWPVVTLTYYKRWHSNAAEEG